MMTAGSIPLMAAMMLPGALPATVRAARASGRPLTAPLFAGSYFVVWALVGLAIYALYRPPAPAVAVVLVAGAVLYELTPLTRACRRRCRAELRSGARFGGWCIGSSIGLMAVFVAIDPMSLPLMCAVGAVALIQKELLTR
jgi:predicted metal-binding membrane protein